MAVGSLAYTSATELGRLLRERQLSPVELVDAILERVERVGPAIGAFLFNQTGHPAASVACGFTSDGLPVGLQIVGRWYAEPLIPRAAACFEAAQPWARYEPPLEGSDTSHEKPDDRPSRACTPIGTLSPEQVVSA